MEFPPPDLSQAPTLPSSLHLVEIVYSDDRSIRVLITADVNEGYRIYPECWDTSDFEIAGFASWIPHGSRTSVTDNLETARAIAQEFIGEIKERARHDA